MAAQRPRLTKRVRRGLATLVRLYDEHVFREVIRHSLTGRDRGDLARAAKWVGAIKQTVEANGGTLRPTKDRAVTP